MVILSKKIVLFALIFAAATAALFLLMREEKEALVVVENSPVEESIYEVFGKYTTYDVTLKNDPTKTVVATCSALIVSWGDDYIISKYKDRIKNGDWVNQMGRAGHLLLNFKLDGLTSEQKDLLTQDKILRLKIKRSSTVNNDGVYCGNYIDVAGVEEYVAEAKSADGAVVRVPLYITGPNDRDVDISCPEGMMPYAIASSYETRTSCAFPPAPVEGDRLIGNGTQKYMLIGYYREYESTLASFFREEGFNIDPNELICKGFVVTGGDKAFIDAYKSQIKFAKIIDGNPVLNLNEMIRGELGSEIPALVLGEIASSTIDRQVTIDVKVDAFPERDTNPCDAYGIYMPVE